MQEINLLARYPSPSRNIAARLPAKESNRAVAKEFGREYFDGPRDQGYGGYRYDGRWIPVAEDIIAHFRLRPGQRILDVGCAKGFLVKDLMKVANGIQAFGLDVSTYAVMSCEPDVVGRLHLGDARSLPFPDGSFDAAVSINTLHNLDYDDCVRAVRELQRVSDGRAYIQVDAYRTEREKQLFLDWMLTAETHGTPEFWVDLFKHAGYTGAYYWTVISG